jgi:hypothetical protein
VHKQKPGSTLAATGCIIQWVVNEIVLITSTSVMPQMGQLPGVSSTTSGCIGQVYLTVWLPLAATSDVLQPVMAGIAAPSTNVISAIVIQFLFFIVVSHSYFEPEFLPVLWGVTRIGVKSAVSPVQFGVSDVSAQARAKSINPRWTSVWMSLTRT